MIKINDKTISSIYSGEKIVEKIYKGTLLVYGGWKKLLSSGVPPLTLAKCKGVDLVDYKIYGESVQDGTPTPEIPIEVESVGDKTSNLYNLQSIDFCSRSSSGLKYIPKIENGILYSGGVLGVSEGAGLYFKIKKNTDYKFSCDLDFNEETETSRIIPVNLFNEIVDNIISTNSIKYVNGTKGKNIVTFNSGENEYFCFFAYSNTQYGMAFSNIYLGEQEEYEPYGYRIPVRVSNDTEEVTTNIYLNEPLRKIGDYADYIDFENKQVVRKIKELDMGDLKWGYVSEVQRFQGLNTFLKSSPSRSDNLLCEIAQPNINANAGDNNKMFTYLQFFYYYSTDYTDEQTFINAVSGKKIIFPLETPTEETIELPNIPTIKGTTILEVDTKVQPSNLEVVYKGKEVK